MLKGKDFFNKAKDMANKAVDINHKVAENITDKMVNSQVEKNAQKYEMYEPFVPAYGLGIKYAFTENVLIYGDEEYSYCDLKKINIVTPPTKLTNGVAQAVTINGKTLTLAYDLKQAERIAKMIAFVNEKITPTDNEETKYKFVFQSSDSTKIEVYEEFIILYRLDASFNTVMKNAMRDGANGKTILFSKLNIQLQESQNENENYLMIEYVDGDAKETIKIPVSNFNVETAKAIVQYIQEVTINIQDETEELELPVLQPVTGTRKEFIINGQILEIPENLDAFNSYRTNFKEIALMCKNAARKEYDKKIVNLSTYLEFFQEIYCRYLKMLMSKVVDICIAEGIYTETEDTLFDTHIKSFHSAIDILTAVLKGIGSTVNNNTKYVSNIMGYVPNLVGGGFGVKGAAKGIAQAEIFNAVRNGIENSLTQNATNLTLAQQEELFHRINPDDLFEIVFSDYWYSYRTLIYILNKNGKNIWLPQQASIDQKNNLFKNLSNPNFPQDKLLETLLEIIKNYPYNTEYFDFLTSRFGETEEVRNLKQYFGY